MFQAYKSKPAALLRAFVFMVCAGFLAKTGLEQFAKFRVSARAGEDRGEYGGDLKFLRHCYTPPGPGESNHYFDLWSEAALPVFTRVNGLTNNHALFVDSHGKTGCSVRGSGYGLYPSESLAPSGHNPPCYSFRDLAQVIGPEQAAQVHNVLLAACNAEGRFRSAELRRYFPNATNITYMTPGELAFKPMFYQAIAVPSGEIRRLFGRQRPVKSGQVECEILTADARDARRLGLYLSDLFLPSGRKPYRTVQAGRERLEPGRQAMSSARD